MTINEKDRQILIIHRLEKADELIKEVHSHIENRHYVTAVNRIYYGMYHSLSALALKNSFITSKHQQLIGWFNKNFVKENLVDQKYGKIINTAFEMRTKGDYDDFVNYDKDVVKLLHDEMSEFVLMIKTLIDK
jgi:uncharacterized protein (UPF0332 family)